MKCDVIAAGIVNAAKGVSHHFLLCLLCTATSTCVADVTSLSFHVTAIFRRSSMMLRL